MDFGDPWTMEQMALVDIAMSAWISHDAWPTFQYVAYELDQRGFDAANVLRSFPVLGANTQGGWHYADVFYDHTFPTPPEDSIVGLTIAGLARHQLGRQAAEMFVRVLSWAAEVRASTPLNPIEVVDLTLSDAQATEALPRIPRQWLQRFIGLVDHEPLRGVRGSGRSPEIGTWRLTVGREITRYRELTIERYHDILRKDLTPLEDRSSSGQVTVSLAAASLGVTPQRVRQLLDQGVLTGPPSEGRRVIRYVHSESVDRYLKHGRAAFPRFPSEETRREAHNMARAASRIRNSTGSAVPTFGHVFVSYVRDDALQVDRLVRELRGRGLSLWLDREDIAPGTRWKAEIRRAIREGSGVISCFSTHFSAREKSYMNEELTLIIDELRERPADKTWFIPLRLNDCAIPDRPIGGGETLRDIQQVDLFPDWDRGVDRLARALGR